MFGSLVTFSKHAWSCYGATFFMTVYTRLLSHQRKLGFALEE
jgi:hypothetical protein